MEKEQKWGTRKEAVEFYGMADVTMQKWRASGKVKSRIKNARDGFNTYEYLLDDELKGHIEIMKSMDNRWKK